MVHPDALDLPIQPMLRLLLARGAITIKETDNVVFQRCRIDGFSGKQTCRSLDPKVVSTYCVAMFRASDTASRLSLATPRRLHQSSLLGLLRSSTWRPSSILRHLTTRPRPGNYQASHDYNMSLSNADWFSSFFRSGAPC